MKGETTRLGLLYQTPVKVKPLPFFGQKKVLGPNFFLGYVKPRFQFFGMYAPPPHSKNWLSSTLVKGGGGGKVGGIRYVRYFPTLDWVDKK